MPGFFVIFDDSLKNITMQSTEEIWKDVLGYEGFYQVSNLGNVLHVGKNRMLAQPVATTGYKVVFLFNGKTAKQHTVHRLICQAFINNPENKRCVNHIDSNRQNNLLANLEWATHKENTRHGYEYGFLKNTKRKVDQFTANGVFIKRWDTIVELISKSKVSSTQLYRNLNKKRPYCSGFIFKYATEN